jgi:hypothetical protein
VQSAIAAAESEAMRLNRNIAARQSAAQEEVIRLSHRVESGALAFSRLPSYTLWLGSVAFLLTCCVSGRLLLPGSRSVLGAVGGATVFGLGAFVAAGAAVLAVLLVAHFLTSSAIESVRSREKRECAPPEDRLSRVRALQSAVESALQAVRTEGRLAVVPPDQVPGLSVPADRLLARSLEVEEARHMALASPARAEPALQAKRAVVALAHMLG